MPDLYTDTNSLDQAFDLLGGSSNGRIADNDRKRLNFPTSVYKSAGRMASDSVGYFRAIVSARTERARRPHKSRHSGAAG